MNLNLSVLVWDADYFIDFMRFLWLPSEDESISYKAEDDSLPTPSFHISAYIDFNQFLPVMSSY